MQQELNLRIVDGVEQKESESSFVGGVPVLPKGWSVPSCELCSRDQTFFVLLTFPEGHAWAGQSVAMFACTSCADESFLIPEMLAVPLLGADVPGDFVDAYQRNFRFLVFPRNDAQMVSGYDERIAFRALEFTDVLGGSIGQVGGTPRWVMGDESPQSVAGGAATFLFQLFPGVEFEVTSSAPPQVELGLDGTPEPSPDRVYRLFLSNALYLWGGKDPAGGVYALTQVD